MSEQYRTLPKDIQEKIKAKARWEGISLTAVMRDYPELWKNEEEDDEAE